MDFYLAHPREGYVVDAAFNTEKEANECLNDLAWPYSDGAFVSWDKVRYNDRNESTGFRYIVYVRKDIQL